MHLKINLCHLLVLIVQYLIMVLFKKMVCTSSLTPHFSSIFFIKRIEILFWTWVYFLFRNTLGVIVRCFHSYHDANKESLVWKEACQWRWYADIFRTKTDDVLAKYFFHWIIHYYTFCSSTFYIEIFLQGKVLLFFGWRSLTSRAHC